MQEQAAALAAGEKERDALTAKRDALEAEGGSLMAEFEVGGRWCRQALVRGCRWYVSRPASVHGLGMGLGLECAFIQQA